MFCDACGTSLDINQNFCGKCGKTIEGGGHPGFPHPSRVQDHIRLLGILWMALSAFVAVQCGVLYIVTNTILFHNPDMSPNSGPPAFLHPLLTFIAGFLLLKAVAGFAAGWGLLQREPWGRVLALVLSFVSLFNVPFGTAVGVYSMWVLLPGQAEQDYDEQVRSVQAARV